MLPETAPQPLSDANHPSDQTPGLHSGIELAYRPANHAFYSHHGNDEEMGDADVVKDDGNSEGHDAKEDKVEEDDASKDDAMEDDAAEDEAEEDEAEEDEAEGDDATENDVMDDKSYDDNDSEEDDVDSKKEVWPREALVAYGSETGTALDFSEEIVDLLRRNEFETKLVELDAVDPASLKNYHLVCIITSTHGDGKVPYNAREFWQNLKHVEYELKGVKFAVFGVGDSKYEKFNWAGRMIEEAMVAKHAKALLRIEEDGLGDGSRPEGVEYAFQHWRQELETIVQYKYPLPFGRKTLSGRLPPKWVLAFADSDSGNPPDAFVRDRETGSEADIDDLSFDEDTVPMENAVKLVVKQNRRITAEDTPRIAMKDIRHFVLEKQGEILQYGPLDVLSIMPKNPIADVVALMKSQGWYEFRNRRVEFVPTETSMCESSMEKPLQGLLAPEGLTIFKLLSHYLDFKGIPRRSFLGKIAQFAGDRDERTRLNELQDDLEDFYDYATRPSRTMAEVLAEFSSVRIPWYQIADIFPLIRSRDFSIASGGQLKTDATGQKTLFELVVDIISVATPRISIKGQPIWKDGLCTSYLASRLPGARIDAVLKRTKVKIRPGDVKESFVMVSCGTGIAPIRSLLYEYEELARTIPGGADIQFHARHPGVIISPMNYMIQGHRNEAHDYLFGDEWVKEIKPSLPLRTYAAFSRPGRGKTPQYVQHLIADMPASALWYPLVARGGIFYICGKAGSFTTEVEREVLNNFVKSGMEEGEAREWIRQMKKNGRWRMEVW